MKISYIRNMMQNSLVLEAQDTDDTDVFVLKMITKNDIEGFITPVSEEMNGRMRLLFDISGKYSMNSLYEMRKMTAKDLSAFLSALAGCASRLGDYLIDAGSVMTDPEYIYTDQDGSRYYFCISPFKDVPARKQCSDLADMIISCIDYSDTALVQAAYKINMALNSDNFSFEGLPALMSDDEDTKVSEEIRLSRAFGDEKVQMRSEYADHYDEGAPDMKRNVQDAGLRSKMISFIKDLF